jgi:hypothetical protein
MNLRRIQNDNGDGGGGIGRRRGHSAIFDFRASSIYMNLAAPILNVAAKSGVVTEKPVYLRPMQIALESN